MYRHLRGDKIEVYKLKKGKYDQEVSDQCYANTKILFSIQQTEPGDTAKSYTVENTDYIYQKTQLNI